MRKKIIWNLEEVGDYESTGNDLKDAEIARVFLKEKGLWKEVTKVQSMFAVANSFAHVSIGLYEDGFKSSPYKMHSIAPFVVNSAFSVELYLKTIHVAYQNGQRGHHIKALYSALTDEAKSIIDICALQLRPRYTLHDEGDLKTCLASINKAFEQWRYMYEHDKLYIELQSIRYAQHSIAEGCRQILMLQNLID